MNTANTARNPFQMMRLRYDSPSGAYLIPGTVPTRHLVFKHRTGSRFTPVAVQLDECNERPAFSYKFLNDETCLDGIYFGEARIIVHPDASAYVVRRCGVIKLDSHRRVSVKCTTPDAGPVWLRMDDLPTRMAICTRSMSPDNEYHVDAACGGGKFSTFFEKPWDVDYYLAEYGPDTAASNRYQLEFGPVRFSSAKP